MARTSTVSIGGSLARAPRWSYPSRPFPIGGGSAQSRNETDANDASMMVQPFP